MHKTKRILISVAVVSMGLVVLGLVVLPEPGSTRYHLQHLGSLRQQQPLIGPSCPADYFRPRTWTWYLQGRPSITKSVAEMEEHQQALIRLGYFERREFVLHHRTLDAQFWTRFNPAVSNATLTDWRWMLHLDDSRPRVLRVTACRADLPTFERIITQIDTARNP